MEDPKKEHERIVVEEYDGIVPMFEAFYLESLTYAADRAVKAFERFDEALKSGVASGQRLDHATIVGNVHEALTHTAAVSRYFWPSRDRGVTAARAKKLRDAFGMTERSPLYNRELRDTLEHFDERLDTFLLQDFTGYIFPGPMVAPAALADDELGKIFRLVDPTTEEFVLLGKKYSFGPIRRAVEKILAQALGNSADGGRL